MACLRVTLNTVGSHCGGGVDHDVLSIKNGEGKDSMKSKTLEEWFPGAAKSGRNFLTVPPHITSLPCGCHGGLPFTIRWIWGKGWIHCGTWNHYPPCGGAVLNLPPVPDPAACPMSLAWRGHSFVK